MASQIPRIVVVGGGAGGLELVTTLGNSLAKKGLAKVYLSDGHPTHIWKPLLHEVATGALNVGEDEVNYFTHGFKNGYRFHYGYMNGLDRTRKVIQTDTITDLEGNVVSGPREFKYDTLILAVGGQTNDFGVPGVAEHCLTLNSTTEAEKIRKRFLGMDRDFLPSQALALAFRKIDKIRVGIVGGGATGVELAAEIHHTMTEIKGYGARISKKSLELSILEAAPRVLPGTAEHMSAFAEEELQRRGIEVVTSCAIKGIDEKGFQLQDGTTIEKDIKIWTAGIKAPEWLGQLGLKTDRINRIMVNEHLQSMEDPSIFAIGDCSHAVDPRDPQKVLPATAQLAHQQAEWLAVKIRNDLLNKPTKSPFMYNSQGMLVSLGSTKAVGTVSGILKNIDLKMKGRSAKALYASLYRMHQMAVYGKTKALFIYLGDKLRGFSMSQVKLH